MSNPSVPGPVKPMLMLAYEYHGGSGDATSLVLYKIEDRDAFLHLGMQLAGEMEGSGVDGDDGGDEGAWIDMATQVKEVDLYQTEPAVAIEQLRELLPERITAFFGGPGLCVCEESSLILCNQIAIKRYISRVMQALKTGDVYKAADTARDTDVPGRQIF
jgi:hypothetical protein